MLSVVLFISFIFLIAYYSTKKPNGFPPGPPRYPIVGYATKIHTTKSHRTYDYLRQKYGDVVGLFLGTKPTVLVGGWEAVSEALNSADLSGRPVTPLFLSNVDEPMTMTGVMFTSGDLWKTQRRFTLHHFRNLGFGKRTHEVHIMDEITDMVNSLTKEKGPVDIQVPLAVGNINILWAILAGIRFNYDDESLQVLVKGVYDSFRTGRQSGGGLLFAFPFLRHVAPDLLGFTPIQTAGRNVKRVVQKAIRDHEKSFDPDNMRDFIDIYLKEIKSEEKDPSFTDKELLGTCVNVMVAGSETGSSLVSYCILYLCLHPEWQTKLHQELDEVLGRNGERLPTIDDKPNLPKTEAFLQEIFRFKAPAPTTVPHTAMNDTTLRGHTIKKNTMLIIDLRSVMMDKEYWGDPEVFRPDRFLTDDGKVKTSERVIPFGKGKRACLGEPLARMTGFLVFASLTARLSFSLPPGEPLPDTEGVTGFTLGPPPFKVLIQERK